VLAASTVMALSVWGADLWLHALMPGDGVLVQVLRVAAAIGTGVGVLALASHVFGVREFQESRAIVLGRMRRLARRRS